MLILILLLIAFLIAGLIEIVSYWTSLSMNPGKVGWLTPKDFKELFDATDWNRYGVADDFTFGSFIELFPAYSLWNYGKGSQLHAGVVQFNEEYYGMYYHTYVYAIFYIRKYYKNLSGACNTPKEVSMWSDVLRRIKEVL